MLDALLATSGVDECFVGRSRFGFCALHGGLEEGTAEIARDAAARGGASFYAVVQPDDFSWHVPSHRYDPAHSDDLRRFLAHVDVMISVHGFGGRTRRRRSLDHRAARRLEPRARGDACRRELTQALPALPLDRRPRRRSRVICAGCIRRIPSIGSLTGGVQLELPPRVRRPGADYEMLVYALARAECATSL